MLPILFAVIHVTFNIMKFDLKRNPFSISYASALRVCVLMFCRYNLDVPLDLGAHVKIVEWFPQNDLLGMLVVF